MFMIICGCYIAPNLPNVPIFFGFFFADFPREPLTKKRLHFVLIIRIKVTIMLSVKSNNLHPVLFAILGIGSRSGLADPFQKKNV